MAAHTRRLGSGLFLTARAPSDFLTSATSFDDGFNIQATEKP